MCRDSANKKLQYRVQCILCDFTVLGRSSANTMSQLTSHCASAVHQACRPLLDVTCSNGLVCVADWRSDKTYVTDGKTATSLWQSCTGFRVHQMDAPYFLAFKPITPDDYRICQAYRYCAFTPAFTNFLRRLTAGQRATILQSGIPLQAPDGVSYAYATLFSM